MLASVRAILFDAVGTLIHPDPPVADVYFEAGRRHGSRLAQIEIHRRFRAAFQQTAAVIATSEERELQRWRRIVATVFDDVAQGAGPLFDELWGHFAQPQHWQVYPDVEPALKVLSDRNIKLGIASKIGRAHV